MVARPITINNNNSKESKKRVSFNDSALTSVFYVAAPEDELIHELFYDQEDYERFRYERNMEIERNIRKQLHSNFRRATRRSSIDLMHSHRSHSASSSPSPVITAQPACPRFQRATRRSSIDLMMAAATTTIPPSPREGSPSPVHLGYDDDQQEDEYGYLVPVPLSPPSSPESSTTKPCQKRTTRHHRKLMRVPPSSRRAAGHSKGGPEVALAA